MKKLLFLLSVVVLMITSCSSPLDQKYNEDTFSEDIKQIQEKIDTSEYQLLVGTILRKVLTDETLIDLTYKELLEEGKLWQIEQDKIAAEQKILAEQALLKEQERLAKLRECVIVTCFDKGFEEYDYQEYITYKFVLQNKSDKDIRAVQGTIIFKNLFDTEIKQINFVYDKIIRAGNQTTWYAQSDYNQFIDSDVALKNKDLDDMKIYWVPEKIMFTDGTILE